jgi:uncharacterized membrane protein YeaQ/YmgE (transglycosylase-associated protein family)
LSDWEVVADRRVDQAEPREDARIGFPHSRAEQQTVADVQATGSEDIFLVAQDLNAQQRVTNMSIIGWIVLGLIAGFIASKIVNKTGEGVLLDIVLGIAGALVGGFLFALFGAEGVTGFDLYSMFVAVIGAIVVLLLYHAVAGRRTTV